MNEINNIAVVIPAVGPTKKIIEYIKELQEVGLKNIIIINDGSLEVYDVIFDELVKEDVVLLKHGVNCGKGRAFKTAFNYIMVNMPDIETIVTADADGTYLPEDVLKVAQNAKENYITLGCRDFKSSDIPPSNRKANVLTYYVLKLLSGIEMHDTQTGLRAYPRSMLSYLLLAPGERYDYDFNTIFDKKEILLNEVSVETTSRMSDKKTHFRAFKDSWIVISSFLIFIIISLSATILDLFIYNFLIAMLIDSMPYLYITVATFLARAVSDVYNFFLDKKLVFKAEETAHPGRYVMLAIGKTAASALLVSGAVFLLGDGELWIKLLVDTLIFFVGYRIEKSWVYGK